MDRSGTANNEGCNQSFKLLFIIASGRTSSPHIVQSRFFDESSVTSHDD